MAEGDVGLMLLDVMRTLENPESAVLTSDPDPQPEDSTTTKAELLERKHDKAVPSEEDARPAKRARVEAGLIDPSGKRDRQKGVAQVKSE